MQSFCLFLDEQDLIKQQRDHFVFLQSCCLSPPNDVIYSGVFLVLWSDEVQMEWKGVQSKCFYGSGWPPCWEPHNIHGGSAGCHAASSPGRFRYLSPQHSPAGKIPPPMNSVRLHQCIPEVSCFAIAQCTTQPAKFWHQPPLLMKKPWRHPVAKDPKDSLLFILQDPATLTSVHKSMYHTGLENL